MLNLTLDLVNLEVKSHIKKKMLLNREVLADPLSVHSPYCSRPFHPPAVRPPDKVSPYLSPDLFFI